MLAGRARLEISPAWKAEFNRLESELNGHSGSSWHQARQAAFGEFESVGLPSTKHEDWKYTNFQTIAKGIFVAAPKVAAAPNIAALSEGARAAQLLFVNGYYSEAHSQLTTREITVRRLVEVLDDEACQYRAAVVAQLAKRDAEGASSGYEALNQALAEDGVVVVIPNNTVVQAPVEIVWSAAGAGKDFTVHPRVVVLAGENSEATIIERFLGCPETNYFNNAHTSLVVGAGTTLRHLKVVAEGKQAYHFGRVTTEIGRAATCATHTYTLSGAVVRNEVAVKLVGEGAHADLFGVSVLGSKEHLDNHTLIDHAVPHCTSNELYKGIYGQQSHGIFSGTIIVREGAQKTNAIQSNNSLLLSSEATIDSRPQLKIWADDVKCTHGATIGQIDPEQLFYLRSRGIPGMEAKNILLHAFMADAVQTLPGAPLQEALQEAISEKLERLL